MITLYPEVLFDIFCMRAATEPPSGEHESRSNEEEKPLVTLAWNLTFMQTPGSGSKTRARIGWYFYKHENQCDWSVRLIGNAEATVGISVTALLEVNFAYSLPGKEFVCKIRQFSVYTRSRFVCVSDSVFERILTSVLEEHFPEIENLTEHHMYHRNLSSVTSKLK